MQNITAIEGDLTVLDAKFAIVAGRFNELIVEGLVSGALSALRRHGIQDSSITLVRVPGAFEIPLAAQRVAASERYDGIIALGAVIRGATPHFDYIASSCTNGLATVALDHDLPLGFGVLTVDTIEQAMERAGTKAGNKGADAALAVLEMVSLLRRLEE